MNLIELFRQNRKLIAEGGNVSSHKDDGTPMPGWQGVPGQHQAQEIDLKLHDRDFMTAQIKALLQAQNESFAQVYGRPIWDPKLLASNKMFSGSSLHFFDVKGISTKDFLEKLKKVKVGDIDTQVDQEIGDEITEWLKSVIGKRVGNGTFVGFNSSLSSIWQLADPPVKIQVDYELGPYDPETQAPTEWFAYSHSADYDDMAAGIKGVFHKYINRALTSILSSTKYLAKVSKKGVNVSSEPITSNDYSFAVAGSSGGGLSKKYKPYIDPSTGEPMMVDGIPVMQELEPKNRDYIQNLDQQFEILYGRKRSKADQKLQNSFVGTIQLLNQAYGKTPEVNEQVARSFLKILFAPGEQMITKNDPVRDRDIKMAAVDAMLLGNKQDGIAPLILPDAEGLRKEAVDMAMAYEQDYQDVETYKKANPQSRQPRADLMKQRAAQSQQSVTEQDNADTAAKPNYARQGIQHIYNRLPDGRVSSMEMKDADFIDLCKEIAANGGNLNGIQINLKIDGAGIRFGKDESGRPFLMTSRVTEPLYANDVGVFTNFGKEKGQSPEQLARTKAYDDALALITGSKFIQTLPSDTIVQAEMLYNPMAQEIDGQLKFVNIPYDPKKLGKQMTLVPFMVKQYSTGDNRPDADKIQKNLLAASSSDIKIVSNNLEQQGINVSKIIQPVLNLNPADKKANKEILDKARQELSSAIIDNPRLKGKDILGDNMEGIVVNMPSGRLVKVTSPKMKEAMASKMASTQTFGDTNTRTAVVAIGNFAGHRGHEQLINLAIEKANELSGTPFVFVGHKVGPDDPIDISTKLETLRKLYPNVTISVVENQIDASGQETPGNIFKKIEYELVKKEPFYNNIVIAVGSDQAAIAKTAAQMQSRYSKFPPLAHVKVSAYVTPRKSDEGGTGVSTTDLRNALKGMSEEDAFKVWSKAYNVQKLGVDWVKHLMDVARKNMGLQTPTAKPTVPVPTPTTANPVVERLFNALVRNRKIVNEQNINTLVQQIARLNNIKDVNKLSVGQVLRLPDGTTYKVKSGDILSNIAINRFKGTPYLTEPTSTVAGAGRGLARGPTAAELSKTPSPSVIPPSAPSAPSLGPISGVSTDLPSTVSGGGIDNNRASAPAGTEPVPANVVRSADGTPVRTGTGGYVTSAFPAPEVKTNPAMKPAMSGDDKLSKLTSPDAENNLEQLLGGPFARLQQLFGRSVTINDALPKVGSSREKQTPNSQHFHGKALDLDISSMNNQTQLKLLQAALDAGFTGIGLGDRILHVDMGPKRSWDYDNARFAGLPVDTVKGMVAKGSVLGSATDNVVRSSDGQPVRTGSGDVVTSGTPTQGPAKPGKDKPIAAILNSGPGFIEVKTADGEVQRREGTANWRMNNPGNIRVSRWTRQQPGFVGVGDAGDSGKFAVFSTLNAGLQAKKNLLFGPDSSYINLSIKDAMYRYAPPSDKNKTDDYIAAIVQATKARPTTTLDNLSAEQKEAMLATINRYEGFQVGQIKSLQPTQAVAEFAKKLTLAKKLLDEVMLPKSSFAGTGAPHYHKLGPAAQAKGKQKTPVKKGQLVGDAEESIENEQKDISINKSNNYVPISEDVEQIMTPLVDSILAKYIK